MKILAQLGLHEALVQRGAVSTEIRFLNERGVLLSEVEHQHPSRYGHPAVNIRRATVHEILVGELERRRIEIHFGKRLSDIKNVDKSPVCVFADGTTVESSMVIGADGIRSRVRSIPCSGWRAARLRWPDHETPPLDVSSPVLSSCQGSLSGVVEVGTNGFGRHPSACAADCDERQQHRDGEPLHRGSHLPSLLATATKPWQGNTQSRMPPSTAPPASRYRAFSRVVSMPVAVASAISHRRQSGACGVAMV